MPDETPHQQSSVAKAGLLLEAFRGPDRVLGVSELARRSGLWKSTAHRLLAELEAIGFVEREGTGYRLGLQLFELGVRVGAYRPGGLRDLAIGELSQLHVATGLTAHLAVLEGRDIVYLEKVHHRRTTRLPPVVTGPGVRHPATCSALGKALLAHASPEVIGDQFRTGLPRRTPYSITEPGRLLRELATVRETGVAREHEEMAIGAVAVASPVLAHGSSVAAISLAGRALGVNWDRAAELVVAASRRIGDRLSRTVDG
ncbi:IclR family transcriptional regulator [Nocardioides sp. zg-DK7169]|uniref:IclR family transcriptional regulator n=1 Tax=Nocardioides sp. zg-DK7169 TaxID=2736600 RepID=UPI0015571328|nr:IclR family transcriptional regulator [Nocardioides sp. zg-DK7169]